MPWFGFWIFMSVVCLVDAYFFNQGYDGLFLSHKTNAEKELQKIKIERQRQHSQDNQNE